MLTDYRDRRCGADFSCAGTSSPAVPIVARAENGAVPKPGELVMLAGADIVSGLQALPRTQRPVRFARSPTLRRCRSAFRSKARTERIWGHLVTPSYFATLGVQPLLGPGIRQATRAARAAAHARGQLPVLAGAPGLRSRRRSERRCASMDACATVIGVGPEEFQGASPFVYGADLWMPIGWSRRWRRNWRTTRWSGAT